MKLLAPFAAIACLLQAGCASVPPMAAENGHLYEYIRSNRDGSLPENIWIYLPSPDEVEVVKIVAPCTDAAYVTAALDPETGSAVRLIAGRLAQDASQNVIGTMEYDAAQRELSYKLGPDGEMRGRLDGVGPRWHLYDYDFTTLAAQAHFRWLLDRQAGFDLVRLIPAEDGELSFERLGEVTLTPTPASEGKVEYRVGGTGLPEGELVRDAADGTILKIASSERNHLEYDDFALRLVRHGSLSPSQWTQKRASHWNGCAD